MSSLLGLSAYSDDDEDGVAQVGVASAPAAAAVLSGLADYADEGEKEKDKEKEKEKEQEEQQSHHHTLNTSTVPTPVAPPSVPIVSSSATPASSPVVPAAAAAASPDTAAPTTNTNAVASSLVRVYMVYPLASAAELAMLPPLPSGTLPPALALRHESNLARHLTQLANPDTPTIIESLLANKSFHNPYVLRRISRQFEIDEYGTNLTMTGIWKEQNLPEGSVEEEDYQTIQNQAEATRSARLATRTSIDFAPPTFPSSSVSTSGSLMSSSHYAQPQPQPQPQPQRVRKSKWDSSTSNPPPPMTTTTTTYVAEEETRKRQKI